VTYPLGSAWDGDLWLQLPQDFASGVGRHCKRAADRNHRDVNFTESFDLLGRQRMAQVAEVRDTNHTKIENEGGALKRGTERLLVNRDVVNKKSRTVVLILFHSAP